jgi:hypothetical protein
MRVEDARGRTYAVKAAFSRAAKKDAPEVAAAEMNINMAIASGQLVHRNLGAVHEVLETPRVDYVIMDPYPCDLMGFFQAYTDTFDAGLPEPLLKYGGHQWSRPPAPSWHHACAHPTEPSRGG